MVKLRKPEVIDFISKKANLSKASASHAVNAFINCISSNLASDKGVQLMGFGTFLVRHRKARKGRNPQTGKPLEISARNVPAFKAGQGLKKVVNK